MGPRPSSRGYEAAQVLLTTGSNLQWGRDLVVADTSTQLQFIAAHLALQWGRDLVVADTTLARRVNTRCSSLQWGRDLVVADTLPNRPQGRPAPYLQWGRDLVVADTACSAAACTAVALPSMGPRPSSRGYGLKGDILICLKNLQWGRDLVVADTQQQFESTERRTGLQWGRDLVVADTMTWAGESGGVFAFNGAAT